MHGRFQQPNERLIFEANKLLAELENRGVRIYLDSQTKEIKAGGADVKEYLEILKLWKPQFIQILRPKCAECGLWFEVLNGEYYCRLGCKK